MTIQMTVKYPKLFLLLSLLRLRKLSFMCVELKSVENLSR